jgi:hypothetical protein
VGFAAIPLVVRNSDAKPKGPPQTMRLPCAKRTAHCHSMKAPFGLTAALACVISTVGAGEDGFTDTFTVDKLELVSVGTNRFFILAPGHRLTLEGREDGQPAALTVTVLEETRLVDGVETRVVEERETVGGELKEVSRNYFAISRRTTDVFYFGEDVDMYEGGRIVSHEGAWLSGADGARFGLIMSGTPLLGARYYQEIAPEVAMDRAEVVGLDEKLKTSAGEFEHCLNTEETSALEGGREIKTYAPGIGLIRDAGLTLATHEFVGR